MKKIISILVHNRPGVLSHVAGLITRRGYNVESIAAGPTENDSITRITLVVAGDEQILEQVTKQLGKLIDVISVEDLPYGRALTGELALITLSVGTDLRPELLNLVKILDLKVVDIQENSLTVLVTGTSQEVNTAINGLNHFTIQALARTGLVALPRPTTEKYS